MDDAPSSIDGQAAVDEDDDKLLTEHHVTLLPPHLLKETPSQRDGIEREEEDEHRRWACGLAQEAGILLKLPPAETAHSLPADGLVATTIN